MIVDTAIHASLICDTTNYEPVTSLTARFYVAPQAQPTNKTYLVPSSVSVDPVASTATIQFEEVQLTAGTYVVGMEVTCPNGQVVESSQYTVDVAVSGGIILRIVESVQSTGLATISYSTLQPTISGIEYVDIYEVTRTGNQVTFRVWRNIALTGFNTTEFLLVVELGIGTQRIGVQLKIAPQTGVETDDVQVTVTSQ